MPANAPNTPTPPPEGQLLIYEEGGVNLRVRLDQATVWLTQAQMAELFQTTKQNVSLHIQHIFEEGELAPEATVKQYLTVQSEGTRQVRRALDHYSLPVILAVGFRVRSARGTAFRQWANARLNELLVKGFTLDDERIKAGQTLGQDYFDELLERVRDIRASERMFYQKITDIYATAIDYDPKAETSQTFFATVQNKLHWAIHGQTAAEVIRQRADASIPNMGLRTWKHAPKGPIRRADTEVAKNYLTESELKELNRIVSMYLDYAEDQARRHKVMHMADWVAKLDSFLEFNERNVLEHAGKLSRELAVKHASIEFEKYKAGRRELEATTSTSDFDRFVQQTERLSKRSNKSDAADKPARPTTKRRSERRKGQGPKQNG